MKHFVFFSMLEDISVHQFKQLLKDLQPDVFRRKLCQVEVVFGQTRLTNDDEEQLLEVMNLEAGAEVGFKELTSSENVFCCCDLFLYFYRLSLVLCL